MSGCRLAAHARLLGDETVDTHLEQVLDTRGDPHLVAVLAGGHDGPPKSRGTDHLHEPH
jgi:hypothetical protein